MLSARLHRCCSVRPRPVYVVETNDYNFDGAMARFKDFQAYKSNDKPKYSSLKVEIENSFSNLQTKLAAFSRPPYVPPEGLSLEDINAAWANLSKAEAAQYVLYT